MSNLQTGQDTFSIQIPGGFIDVNFVTANALNDLFKTWHGFQVQIGYVLPRRLDAATHWRARFLKALAL